MTEPTYTASEIFRHLTPSTLCALVSDIDGQEPNDKDKALMQSAIYELFALVGMEAVAILDQYDVYATHPMVMAAVEAYNEDGE